MSEQTDAELSSFRRGPGLMDATLDLMRHADERWRPTNFWQPAIAKLAEAFRREGFANFRSMNTGDMFVPRYGQGYTADLAEKLWPTIHTELPSATRPWLDQQVLGSAQAHRDLDVAMASWNQREWPIDFDLCGLKPPGGAGQSWRLLGSGYSGRFDRAHLNYLMMLALLSRHVKQPPRSFLEIGGGYGALGSVLAGQPSFECYVDVDIPPLLAVATFYLSEAFGPSTTLDALQAAAMDSISPQALEQAGMKFACLPPWTFGKIDGHFDVFVNSYSFQEMEPSIVGSYADEIAALAPDFVVSVNSKMGKVTKTQVSNEPGREGWEGGVVEPVTTDFIERLFTDRGYQTLEKVGRPWAPPQANLLIMRRAA